VRRSGLDIIGSFEAAGNFLDGKLRDIKQGFDGDDELFIPWAYDAQVLGHHLLVRLWVA
jgi:hypothetical protein